MISNLVTDYIQKRRGEPGLFSFEYDLLPKLISNFYHYMDQTINIKDKISHTYLEYHLGFLVLLRALQFIPLHEFILAFLLSIELSNHTLFEQCNAKFYYHSCFKLLQNKRTSLPDYGSYHSLNLFQTSAHCTFI